MIPPHPVDVLVVGFGPVGAAVGNLLGRYGVRTLVIDRAQEIFQAPRAIVLDNEALRILQMMGLDERAFERVRIPRVRMISPLFGQYACADTSRDIDGQAQLVTFYQPELESALRQRLTDYPGVQIVTGAELVGLEADGGEVRADLRLEGKTATVRASYVVGADGASSTVRRLLHIPFEGRTYSQDWLIVDAKCVPTPIDDIEFLCDPSRPGPHMVAPGGRQRWEFMLRPGETLAEMERPLIAKKLLRPWTKGGDVEIERVAVYRFHARTADRFSSARCHLVGDAAHITPPFAGQGLVAGLRDAANLSWKLAWAVKGRCSPTVLESYDSERRPHAKAMINFALFMGALVMPRSRLKALLVHGAMLVSGHVPGLRNMFRELKVKPKNQFRRGLFLPHGRASRLRAGAQFPQVQLRAVGSRTQIASDDALGDRMVLLLFGSNAAARLGPALAARWSVLGGGIVRIIRAGTAGTGPDCYEDVSGELVPGIAAADWVAILRPDRTIVADGPAAEAAEMIGRTLDLFDARPEVPRRTGRDKPAWRLPPHRNRRTSVERS